MMNSFACYHTFQVTFPVYGNNYGIRDFFAISVLILKISYLYCCYSFYYIPILITFLSGNTSEFFL